MKLRFCNKHSLVLIRFFVLPLFLLCLNYNPAIGQAPDSTHQLLIEKIEIEGNTRTKPEVIHRYLTIKPGDAVNPVVLEANRRRLSQTNFFKEVDLYTQPGSQKGRIVLVIEVEERSWPYFQFEGGHSDLNGWYFVPVSFRFDNLLGNGHFFGVKWTLGDRISKGSLNYRNPHLFGEQAFLDLELFGGNQEFIHYFGPERATQTVNFNGLQFKVGGTQGAFKHIHFAYRTETFEPDFVAQLANSDAATANFPADIADDLNKTKVGAVSLIFNADFRDNPIYPLNGFWGALSTELAHHQIGSDRDFPKITLDARFFKRVVGRTVFAVHVKGGYATAETPFFERFYLGGANSLRGYPDRRLTPEGYGTKLILTNAEFRFPLTRNDFPYHKVSGVLFFDAGSLSGPGQTPKPDDFFASLGFGYRVKLPVVGITRFDFAFPLNKVDDNDFQFHVSLGHTF